jgi:hypothetical protein
VYHRRRHRQTNNNSLTSNAAELSSNFSGQRIEL